MPAVRQKLHLSSCPDFRDQLYLALLREVQGAVGKLVVLAEDVNDIRRFVGSFPEALVCPWRPQEPDKLVAFLGGRAPPAAIRASAGAGELLHFEGCTLDVPGRIFLDADRQEVALTRGEFTLLIAFVRNSGRVLSRDQLRNAIDGGSADAYDRSIDMLVARLRRKIEPDPAKARFIVTVPGVGYKFVPRAAAHARSLITLSRRELDADLGAATKTLVADIERDRVAATLTTLNYTDVTNQQKILPSSACEPPHESINADYQHGQPSLAVLPLINMGADEKLACISEGITEDIVTGLARNKSFSVIAPGCSCRDADELRRIAGELGVGYLLVCTARRANDDVRLTVRLLDAHTRVHIWAQRYTHEIPLGFAGLDAITANIAASIEPHIYAAEGIRLRRTPLPALDPAGCVIAALSIAKIRTRQNLAVAEGLLKRAIELDPAGARAHSLSVFFTGLEVVWGWKSRENALPLALDAAHKAVLLDDHDCWAHFALGWALTQNRSPEEGIEEYQRAIAINPDFSFAHSCLGLALGYVGRIEKALAELETAERLAGPEIFVGQTNTARAGVYFCAENYRDAIAAARRALQRAPFLVAHQRHLVVSCALAGEMEEARAGFKTLVRLVPDLSLSSIASALPNIRDNDLNRTLDAFRLMGVRS